MDEKLLQMLEVQGEMKVRLMGMGFSQDVASKISCDLFNDLMTSPIVTDEHRQRYKNL